MADKKRILFVDDEPNILAGLRRIMRPLRKEWEMAFANNGHEALAILSVRPFDVVVSDMRMPGMNGVELLKEVRKHHPETVCIALSGESAKESVLNYVGPIHQYLPKPCDPELLRFSLSRIAALRNILSVDKLRAVLALLEGLPSLPSLYRDLMRQFESPDGSLREVGQIVSRDMAMSAKVLQLANSAFFGARNHIPNPHAAVAALGMDTVKALALSVCVFSVFEDRALKEFKLHPLWEHSTAAAVLAKRITLAEQSPREVVGRAFTAGLLHDVGKLVFAAMLPMDLRKVLTAVRSEGRPMHEVERDIVGASHSEVGAYLLGLWGFSEEIIEALAYHHRPREAGRTEFGVLTAVHVANVLAHQLHPSDLPLGQMQVDPVYLSEVRKASRLSEWRDICLAVAPEEVAL